MSDQKMNKKAKRLPNERPEKKFYGVRVIKTIFALRKNDIIRVYLTEERIKEFSNLLKWCAGTQKAYHVVGNAALEQITESNHHEGICILAFEKTQLDEQTFLESLDKTYPQGNLNSPILWLAEVGNHHNIGAILRSAAHFGLFHIVIDSPDPIGLSGSLARVSEGGCEHLQIITPKHPKPFLTALQQKGFQLLGATQKATQSLYHMKKWPVRSVLFLGNEVLGIPQALLKLCDIKFAIPGSQKVESLNVSVAAGICLAQWHQVSLGGKLEPPSSGK